MPVELLLLLLAWAATVSLLIVLPWAIIRFVVGVLEADVSKPGADHEHAQPRQPPDTAIVTALSHETADASESDDAVSSPAVSNGDVDR